MYNFAIITHLKPCCTFADVPRLFSCHIHILIYLIKQICYQMSMTNEYLSEKKQFSNRFNGKLYSFRLETYIYNIILSAVFEGDKRRMRAYLKERAEYAVNHNLHIQSYLRYCIIMSLTESQYRYKEIIKKMVPVQV